MKKQYCLLLLIYVVFLSCSSQHERGRQTEDFTENWLFHLGDDSLAYLPEYDDSRWRQLELPHDWSIEADFSEDNPATPGGGALPGGIGWYRKEFMVDKSNINRKTYIDFDGIYWNSEVWLNGQLLGKRPNGYLSFRYDLTPYLKFGDKNVIAVKVDNSQQPNSRWYTGSGIYRNVRLVTVNPVHVNLWGTYITTPLVSEQAADIKIIANIKNDTDIPQKIDLYSVLLDSDEKVIAQINMQYDIPAHYVDTLEHILNINNPRLWSIEDPYMYKVITRIKKNGVLIDDYETPIGIRSFEFDADKGFILNGKPVKIKGVGNHHDLGCLGTAVNVRAMERQLEMLKQMGCNGIRTVHNPPAPELLDLCDKMGFIVMDEAFDMWRKKKSPYDYSRYFAEWYERDLTDLILRDRNHPSIFMWSVGNEVLEQWTHIDTDTLDLQKANIMFNFANVLEKKDEAGNGLHVSSLLAIKLADIAKKLDPTRPVTAGNNDTGLSNHVLRSGAMDIIGFNYHHKDWENPEFHKKFPGQKLIITESTSALMSRGYYEMPSDSVFLRPVSWDVRFDLPVRQNSSYDNVHVPWGTTHEETWRLVKQYDHISGVYVWTGFDYLGEPTPFWWPARSSYFGIIDLAGFPKDVYYMYQSEWSDKDVLHIFPHWNWKEGMDVDVWAYYNNADEVELYLNGKSLGKRSKKGGELHVIWRVPFEKGTIKAISRKAGKEVLIKEIKTTEEPVAVNLVADRLNIKSDGRDLSFITAEVLDKAGNPVPDANNMIRFEVEGEGVIVGTDNGDPIDSVSLKKPERNLFNGKALVVVKSNRNKGLIKVKAYSEGLRGASIEINTINSKH